MELVFKIFAPSSSFHGVRYNDMKQKKGIANLLHFDNFGALQDGRAEISKKEFEQYLKAWSGRNERIKNPQFHAMLGCKGKEHNHIQLKEMALEMMSKLGYDGIPILVYAHHDTANNHVHIVTSRVGLNGKKINHDFEHLRANEILNKMVGLEPTQILKADIENAISYRFGTVSQFKMLMELKGYQIKEKDNTLFFYKHGNEQGSIPIAPILSHIDLAKGLDNLSEKSRIKALLYKYAKQFESGLIKIESVSYFKSPEKISSELTLKLQEKFGIEFVFFASKENDFPYGYAIIDHPNKTVYKGSEIMMLGLLNELSTTNNVNAIEITFGSSSSTFVQQKLFDFETASHQDGFESDKSEYKFSSNNSLNNILDAAKEIIPTQINKTNAGAKSTPRRKKKRGRFY